MKLSVEFGADTFYIDVKESPGFPVDGGESGTEFFGTISNEDNDEVIVSYRPKYGTSWRAEVNWKAHGSVNPYSAAKYARLIAFAAQWIATVEAQQIALREGEPS